MAGRRSTLSVVVDTMVFAYALLGVEEFRDEAAAVLEQADRIIVPDSFRAEFANVLWQWVRRGGVDPELAGALLWDADSLITHTLDSGALWEQALHLAVTHDHPAYDTLFIAAAELSETQLVTFDKQLKNVFPQRVVTSTEFLARQ